MNKKFVYTLMLILTIFILSYPGNAEYSITSLDKVILSKQDIPMGFQYGIVPRFYTKVLKGNPWMMDNSAIRKLARNIYPDGDYRKISNIHVSILANKNQPYGDDIVCYVILYKNISAAKKEVKKITDFTYFNRDRAIVVNKDNIVVFLHVDNVNNFHHIKNIASRIETRIEEL